MARRYHPKRFLREALNKLLKEYCERHGVDGVISWRHESERDTNLAFAARDLDGRWRAYGHEELTQRDNTGMPAYASGTSAGKYELISGIAREGGC